MRKNYSQTYSQRSGLSSVMACSNLSKCSFYFELREHKRFRHGSHENTVFWNFIRDCVKPCNTSWPLPPLIDLWDLPKCLLHCSVCLKLTTQPWSCYMCWWFSFTLISPDIYLFLFQILSLLLALKVSIYFAQTSYEGLPFWSARKYYVTGSNIPKENTEAIHPYYYYIWLLNIFLLSVFLHVFWSPYGVYIF